MPDPVKIGGFFLGMWVATNLASNIILFLLMGVQNYTDLKARFYRIYFRIQYLFSPFLFSVLKDFKGYVAVALMVAVLNGEFIRIYIHKNKFINFLTQMFDILNTIYLIYVSYLFMTS